MDVRAITLAVMFAGVGLVSGAQPVDIVWGMASEQLLETDFAGDGRVLTESEFLEEASKPDGQGPLAGSWLSSGSVDHLLAQGYNEWREYDFRYGYSRIIIATDWAIGIALVSFYFLDNALFEMRAIWPDGNGELLYRALVRKYGTPDNQFHPEWSDGNTTISYQYARPFETPIDPRIIYHDLERKEAFAAIVEDRIEGEKAAHEGRVDEQAAGIEAEL